MLNLPNVVGGMLLPLVLVLMILLCNDHRLMGRYINLEQIFSFLPIFFSVH